MSTERAIFAGGCFWCMVEPFEERPGILAVTSGYTGGHIEYPTYDQVLSKASGHTEAVEILFDNELISYDELLDIYWSLIDPTDADGQIYDRGANYRPVIFVESEEQRIAAQKSKIALEKSGINQLLFRLKRQKLFGQLKNIINNTIKKILNVTKRCTKHVNVI